MGRICNSTAWLVTTMLFSFCLKITVKLHLYGKYPDTRKLTRRGRPPHAHKSSYTYRQILSQEIKITRKFYRPSIHFQACQKLINTLFFVVLLICERAMNCHLFGKQQYSSTKNVITDCDKQGLVPLLE